MAASQKCRVLIANRGEIAARIILTCTKLGLDSVAVYTEPDALSLHETMATDRVCLGANPRAYLDGDKLLEIAKEQGCHAVHPGYGFLSENVGFATACEEAGIVFLGPSQGAMEVFSEKHTARALAEESGVPTLAGTSLLASAEEATKAASEIGLPILLKATGGGGGMGILLCRTLDEVEKNFETAGKQGDAFFGNAGVFAEKYVEKAHHVEVQIFGDGKGNVIHLGERECSIQRRHQKILEETPSPLLDSSLRSGLTEAAVRLCSAAKYRSAGTVEFLVDEDTKKFYFLEVNTRLQVEHGITEMVNGNVDLVEWMLRLQLSIPGSSDFDPKVNLTAFKHNPSGHSIEVRLCAENPSKDFAPSPGTLGLVSLPSGPHTRVDSWISTGTEVSAFYDSLLAKILVWGENRDQAIHRMEEALKNTEVQGIPTNLEFLQEVVESEMFKKGNTTTKFLDQFDFVPHTIEVISPGMLTTVQDYPGRTKLWHVGVPPSGPMDNLSFRLANALVGNDESAAGLEITMKGPKLLFRCDSVIAITGAEIEAKIDDKSIPNWTSVSISRGQTLSIGDITTMVGARSYLAVWGGLQVPHYLHSRSTFIGGKFGGVQGRPLASGDTIPVKILPSDANSGLTIPEEWKISIAGGENNPWEVEVLPGPYAAPDYFTEFDIETLYSSNYTVHYNSNRLGIRLEGAKPQWARKDGGEGGSHPSNLHDYTYAVGAVNYTGDMPVVLGVDGPSLGGFVCPCVVLSTELWKMGQVRANDTIVWKKVSLEHAYIKKRTTDLKMDIIRRIALGNITVEAGIGEFQSSKFDTPKMPETKALIKTIPESDSHPGAQYRLSGDRFLLVEYGPVELDLNLRVRVNLLRQWLMENAGEGIVEVNPGVRSLLVEYDQVKLPFPDLIELLDRADGSLPDAHGIELQSRVVHLPLAFNEKWTHEAIDKYARSVRPEATYIPSNVDFLAKNNGLEGGSEAVRDVIFSSSYLVLGLGDVYLGACCAVPVDPRHRLVAPKYNPARTFTPEGAMGIGGTYMCIYPMESPGGYQLMGRTLSMWNTYGRVKPFSEEKPWLLDFFDQVRFFEVSEDEIENLRKDFKAGKYEIKMDHEILNMKQYNQMVESIADETAAIKARQKQANAEQNAIDAEILKRLKETSEANALQDSEVNHGDEQDFDDEAKFVKVPARVSGNIWEVRASVGDIVEAGQTLVILEAMKMEYDILAPLRGLVKSIRVSKSQLVSQGSPLVVLETLA
ncbi:hypothetical protein BSKO_08839 [Bryopsis sp. KO-2023]|nr:hypothetical protein BSKO_08839 [Bryopsis sp. KO-2023]